MPVLLNIYFNLHVLFLSLSLPLPHSLCNIFVEEMGSFDLYNSPLSGFCWCTPVPLFYLQVVGPTGLIRFRFDHDWGKNTSSIVLCSFTRRHKMTGWLTFCDGSSHGCSKPSSINSSEVAKTNDILIQRFHPHILAGIFLQKET